MEKIKVNFFSKRKDTYIQKEHEKVFGNKSPFTDQTTFHIVKMFYLSEIFKLRIEKNKRKDNAP